MQKVSRGGSYDTCSQAGVAEAVSSIPWSTAGEAYSAGELPALQGPRQVVRETRMTYQGHSEHMRSTRRLSKPGKEGEPGALRHATPQIFMTSLGRPVCAQDAGNAGKT